MIYLDFMKQQHMDTLYRYLEYPKYVPQCICRIEWVKEKNALIKSYQSQNNRKLFKAIKIARNKLKALIDKAKADYVKKTC